MVNHMGPSTFDTLVQTLITTEENDVVLEQTITSAIKALESGQDNLLSLIKSLGKILTSTDDGERKVGTCFLASILKGLSENLLSEKEAEHLVTFFTERLKDVSHIIPSVIQGLLCLSSFQNLPKGSGSKILLSLYHSVHIPTQLQIERYACYSILANLLSNPKQLQQLQTLPLAQQSEIVLGFLQACDGERDPRCLLLSFRVGKAIASNFPLGAMTEDFFESFNCYFPVDFKPPDKNSRGITREDLSIALRDCLSCSSSFAEFLFPFILDKLDSTLVQCKIDSFDIIKEVCKIYNSENFEPFLYQLWNKIRSEILTSDSNEVEEIALESLSCLVSALHGNCLQNFVSKIWKECEALLDTSSDGLKMIIAIAKASEIAGYSIIKLGMPLLLAKANPKSDETEARRIGALSAICSFLNLEHKESFNEIWLNCGSELLSTFFSLWHVSGQTKLLCLRGLTLLLTKCPSCWTEHEINLLTQHLIFWTKELESDSQANLSECWSDLALEFAKFNSELVSSKLLPLWLENLNKSLNINKSISLLSSISQVSNLNDEIIKDIIGNLNSNDFNIIHLKCLLEVVIVGTRQNQSFSDELFSSCLLLLVPNCISSVFDTNFNMESYNDRMNLIRLILECLSPSLCIKNGVALGTLILNLYIENPGKINALSFEKQVATSQLSLSVIAHLSTEALNNISRNHLHSFVMMILSLIESETQGQLALLFSQILACIINKRDQVEEVLQTVEEALFKKTNSKNLVTVWIWICKALVLKSYNYPTATEKLMEFLGNADVGNIAAEGFYTILADAPRVMSETSKANIKLFYRQRFFMITQKQLLELYHNSTNGDLKNNYLRALSHQLKFLPTPILRKELPPLLPMLISSLSNENNDLLISTLASLKEVLNTDVTLATDKVDTLLKKLTVLASAHPNLAGRVLALECLFYLANLPEEHILNSSNDVLMKIRPCLDDRKRLVRKQASITIAKWYLIGSSKD